MYSILCTCGPWTHTLYSIPTESNWLSITLQCIYNHRCAEVFIRKYINPRCMRCRVMVVVLSVSVTATYLVYTSKIQCHRALRSVFKVSTVWLLLKMLCSTVLADNHHLRCSLMSSQWTRGTAMAPFQCDGYVHSAISPRTRLAQY